MARARSLGRSTTIMTPCGPAEAQQAVCGARESAAEAETMVAEAMRRVGDAEAAGRARLADAEVLKEIGRRASGTLGRMERKERLIEKEKEKDESDRVTEKEKTKKEKEKE